MVRWSEGRKCCAVAPCPSVSSVLRCFAYRAFERVTEDTVRVATAAAPAPAREAERPVAASEAARVQDHSIITGTQAQPAQHDAGMRPKPQLRPQPRPQLQPQPQPQPEQVRVQLAQVPRGEGTLAT